MKFCTKLQKLRKEKHLSQEQLADMLDVSRQSVSKWEGGSTYPEMDKLIEICKIFNVTLDDLTNDNVKEFTNKKTSKNNISNLVYSILDLIKRSYEMLRHMTFKNILSCIIEMLFIVLLFIIFRKTIFNVIYNLGTDLFEVFPYNVSSVLSSIWHTLLEVVFIILAVIIFTYIYKIRYLDRYEEMYKEEHVEKPLENNIKQEKNKDIKTDKANNFFDVLSSIFMFFIKIFVIFMGLPFIFSLVFLGMILIIYLVLLLSGVLYIGMLFIIISSISINLIILYIEYYIIFNKTINVKNTFIIMLISLLVFGVGIGITSLEFVNTSFTDNVSNITTQKTIEKSYKMQDDLIIVTDRFYSTVTKYEINNDLKDEINIKITYYNKYNDYEISKDNNYIMLDHKDLYKIPLKDMYKIVVNDLKHKTIHNYNRLLDVEIIITSNETNIEKIRQNIKNYEENIYSSNMQDRIDDLYSIINEKEEEIQALEDTNTSLMEENEYLKKRLSDINDKLNEITSE